MNPTEQGKRYELYCPISMPNASTFLWNKKMLLQLNCRGYSVAQHMQPEPAKYSYGPMLEQKTFMQPEQPQYAHHPGRFVYVRDSESGDVFSAPFEPSRAKLEAFTFSAGTFDVQWRAKRNNIAVSMSVALPLNDVAELWTIKVTNDSDRTRKIDLFPCFSIGYMSWMNQSADYSKKLGGIVAQSVTPYQKLEDYPLIKTLKDCTVMLHDKTPLTWEARRDAFEGEGGIHQPDGVLKGELSNSEASYETPIAALQYRQELQPGEAQEFKFIFAPVKNEAQAIALRTRYFGANGFEQSQKEIAAYQQKYLGCISINTPDYDLNNFVNHWLNRQVFYHGNSNRLTTDPQTRNYLQDAIGMNYVAPDHSRSAILLTLSQQKSDGALPEGVKLREMDELKYINQIPHTDHCVWLPIVLRSYLDETGDYELLNEMVGDQSIYGRTNRAMQWLINNRDDRGLSLIAQGDWCDPLNMVGHKGKGISGWLTIATVHALKTWSDILQIAGYIKLSDEMKKAAEDFTEAAQKHLWDGDWFARGISDDGIPLGVSTDDEGKIWLNPQSWSLISGVATAEQKDKILEAVKNHLETPFGPMVLAPSYTSMKEHVGRVTQKHPGTAENGAIYCHAAAFYIFALYLLDENDHAFDILKKLLPGKNDEHYLNRGQLPVFLPNYYRGAVKQIPRTAGRSSQLFNTGAASWIYRIVIEQLFGVRGTAEGLSIKPNLPNEWENAHIVRKFRGATFNITIRRSKKHTDTKVSVSGNDLNDTVIREYEADKTYEVEVVIPAQVLRKERCSHA